MRKIRSAFNQIVIIIRNKWYVLGFFILISLLLSYFLTNYLANELSH